MNQRKPSSSGCLICGSDDVKSRGLCDIHYRRFNAKQKKIAAEQGETAAEKFEADCLADGWILPKTKGGRPKDADPFDVIAAKIVAECAGLYSNSDADAAVASGDRVIKKAVSTRRKNGGTKADGKKGMR